MPATQSRPTAIPRSPAPKRAIPPLTPAKKRTNEPIPLRGTRPSATAATPDTYTPLPPRSRIPSTPRFHVPVMHSPMASVGGKTQGGRSAPHSIEATTETKEIPKESDEETEYASSESDDVALSPGFSRIMALLDPDGNAAETQEMTREESVKENAKEIEDEETPRATNVDSVDSPKPAKKDSTKTPTADSRSGSGGSEARAKMRTTDAWRKTVDAPLRPAPRWSQDPPAPYAILEELETLLGPATVAETVDIRRILSAHDACPAPSAPANGVSVFGMPLCAAARYASCSTVLGGQKHMLPIVVFAAIEELYRAGLTSPHLLRPASTSRGTTLPALVAAFDTGPTYGDGIDLAHTRGAPTPLDDVSALLLTYLDCLPGPIIVRPLLSALRRTPTIRAAQLVLRLLPAPHFSLLVYLLAFLAQVPAYQHANGWSVPDIAEAFARAVCGAGEDEDDGCDVLAWLLQNWDALSAGLFSDASGESAEEDLDARIAALERQHAAAVRAAYAAGAAAERSVWAGEVQALREAWEREGVVMNGIVRRFAEGAPGQQRGR